MQNQKVRKAVIAAAGFGTRFLPQTKAMPKEMMPLIDKPVIQYVVEELVGAGIEDIVIVTGYHKRSLEDHFDVMSADLTQNLEQAGKHDLLEETRKVGELANFAYVRQKGPYGNATPILNAEHLIGDEPFIYAFADDFFVGNPSRFQQMINMHNRTGSSVVACKLVEKDEDYKRYGIVAGEPFEEHTLHMRTIVEKPGVDKAPSNLASVGGYLFTPDIFPCLHDAKKILEPGKELMVQTAMQMMIDQGRIMLAYEIQNSKYYDTGNKLEYMKTVIDFALQHEDIKDEFYEHLKSIVKE